MWRSLYSPHLAVLVIWTACNLSGGYASAGSSDDPATVGDAIHFRIVGEQMLIVPVLINGCGPFDFVLDTGSSRTIVDKKLASQLALKADGSEDFTSLTRTERLALGRLDEIRLASAVVRDAEVGIVALDGLKAIYGRARGILGEDFFSHFDFLLDYRRHTLTFEKGSGDLLRGIQGERISVRESGAVEGLRTVNRLIVTIQSPELSVSGMSFQLDSGATLPVLFPNSADRMRVDVSDRTSAAATTAECANCSLFRIRKLRVLQVGKRMLSNVLMAIPDVKGKMDTDGLLPTSLFRSIYISHSSSFVIVDPETLPVKSAPTLATVVAAVPGGNF
jgi:predicted aspartyl protease